MRVAFLICFLLCPTNTFCQFDAFHYFSTDELHQTNFTSAAEDKYGRIWFGSNGGGIIIYDGYSFQQIKQKDSAEWIFSNSILNIQNLDSTNMLISTTYGVSSIDINNLDVQNISNEIFDVNQKKNTFNVECAIKSQDNTIWLGGFNGLIHLDSSYQLIKRYNIGDGISNRFAHSNHIIRIIEDNQNSNMLFIGTEYGLMRLDKQNDRLIRIKNPTKWHSNYPEIEQYEIWDMDQDPAGNVWLACMYSGGVLRYSPKENKWQEYRYKYSSKVNPNFRNAVSSVRFVNDSLTLFAGTFGIGRVRVDKQILEYASVFDENRISRIREIFLDSKGYVWLLGEMGLARSKHSIANPSQKHRMIIYLNGNRTQIDEHLLLESHTKYIQIEICLINHFNNSNIHYQYKIDDQLWQDIGNARFVTLTGMNAGKHIVYARSNIGEGLWIEAKPREIFIEKPYYLKTHFLLTGLIFLLFIFFGIYRLLRFIANKEAKIKLSYSRELAQIEMKALRSQMNPHFIFNSLNSIYNFILTNNTNQAADYLSKFSKLIRKVLENSKHTRVHIDDELQVISLYMELEKLRFNDKFDYELDIDSQIDQSNIQIPPMIIQPFLENAVWHGIMHKNQGGLIRLSMRMHQKNLIVEIEDNGIGRIASKKLNTNRPQSQISLGTSITQERLNLLRELYQINITSQIKDKVDSMGHSLGTLVTIHLPLLNSTADV